MNHRDLSPFEHQEIKVGAMGVPLKVFDEDTI